MRVPLLISAFLVVTACHTEAQPANTFHPSVAQVLNRMTSAKLKERQAALDDALTLLMSTSRSANDADKLRLGIIQLLVRENDPKRPREDAAQQTTADQDNEERSEYFAGLVATVADLNDERAIPVLLSVSGTGGIATQGVARFGKKALDATLEYVKGRDAAPAADALFVVRDMLALRTVSDPDSTLRIKKALRAALASPAWDVRTSAVYAVEYLDDREEFVPILTELANHDPFKLGVLPQDDGSIVDFYTVRHNAKRVLENIAKHERPPAPPIQGR